MGGRKLGLSGKDNVQRLVFIESLVEFQVPLKTWNLLATKIFLKELNNTAQTNTHTPESTSGTTKSTGNGKERPNTQETSP